MSESYYLLIGSYGDGKADPIQKIEFQPLTRYVRKIASVGNIQNPSYLAVANNIHVYAINEIDEGEIVSFRMNENTGKLTELHRQSSSGSSPCYVHYDEGSNNMFIANYGSGSVSVHAVSADGRMANAQALKIQAYNEQGTSHPHMVHKVPNTCHYVVPDLGIDQLFVYEYVKEKLHLRNTINAIQNSGPRHLIFHPTKRIMYVANEYSSSVSVYEYDLDWKQVHLIQSISTIPLGVVTDNYCAHIHISERATKVYVSNRGHNSIATFNVLHDGRLEAVTYTSTIGEWPRHFTVHGDYMFIANERSHSVNVMKLDVQGIPEPLHISYAMHRPAFIYAYRG
ncbi:lactonase family protein [Halalkalibacter hemicellulosilyticus]|uniref:6-phosphogluconolactonase n=1 Tax=Halalkalibacter hemicellulosilyticusJCM 9152 TaxID=1236971 RepID=W4QLK6_9BACI|nr:lactonase family protein [Halalkalibacter hemicellulosilyticus]GAE32518.1 6-phosphogluconolactonase [Halalkalibacter hemicellulosilyticusJCM 9152]